MNKERVAVLGIGSELRGDDIAGILVIKELQQHLKNRKKNELIRSKLRSIKPFFKLERGKPRGIDPCPDLRRSVGIKLFNGSTAPENLTGEIRKYKPTHIIIVDSAEIDKRPGAFKILNAGEIEGTAFSTHRIPIKIMADYFRKIMDCSVLVIGIQPKTLDFGAHPQKAVIKSAKKIAEIILGGIYD